jgi:predicted AlkP superfamily phosphohydrolase/phosphomutase
VAIFMTIDRVQHYLWRHLDPHHPRYDPVRSPALAPDILSLYRQVDSAVGELTALSAPDALILVASDHGFNGCHRAVSINTWLANSGWLTPRVGTAVREGGARFLRWLRRVPGARRLKAALPGIQNVPTARAWHPDPTDWIDWAHTAAYFSDAGGIRINLRGREPQGAVAPEDYETLRDEIITGLLELKDPQSGIAPIAAVYRREDLYVGPYVDLAPDLIVEPHRDAADPRENYLLAYGVSPVGALFSEPARLNGNHDLEGILIAAGPGVKPGVITGARLWDLAPTLCVALGVPPLAGLDGEVLPALVSPLGPVGVRARGETHAYTTGDATGASGNILSTEDEAEVTNRLRALGYLSQDA